MEEGLADRLVQVGIRTMTGHQREQAQRFGVEVIEMKDWRDGMKLEFSGSFPAQPGSDRVFFEVDSINLGP